MFLLGLSFHICSFSKSVCLSSVHSVSGNCVLSAFIGEYKRQHRVQCVGDIRQKDHYEVKWFIPLVELSLEDKLLSPGISPVSCVCTVAVVFCA